MYRRTAALLVFVFALTSAQAQWLDHPDARIPRTPDGKANLSAPAPKTADGHLDFSGIWTTDGTGIQEMERLFPDLGTFAVPGDDVRFFPKYFVSVFADVKPEDVPMRPEAARLLEQRIEAGFGKDVPTAQCLPAGIPMGDLLPAPRRFVHIPGIIAILYEGINPQRVIHTDGRDLPVDPIPTWMGYSTGKWDGDTLVIETAGFNGRTWLDAMGHPHTEALRMTERWRRPDFGHMQVEVTFDDPKAYTKPFSIRYTQTLMADTDLMENICGENQKLRSE